MTAPAGLEPLDRDRRSMYGSVTDLIAARARARRSTSFPEEFARFYSESAPRLHVMLLAQGFDWHTAADAVADTMAQVGRQWGQLHSPYGWSRTAAWRRALRLKQQTHDLELTDFTGEAFSDGASVPDELVVPDIAEHVVATDSAARVRALLDTLPTRQRLVMQAHVAGDSDQAIAEWLGVDVATVRSSRRHARERLRARLAE